MLMEDQQLMSPLDIHAFGIEVVSGQLEKADWVISSIDALCEMTREPQIVASLNGEQAMFVVRTAMYPERGKIEGEGVFRHFAKMAKEQGMSCYFASVSIANSKGETDEEMSTPIKGVAYHVAFDGLVKMELPPENENEIAV